MNRVLMDQSSLRSIANKALEAGVQWTREEFVFSAIEPAEDQYEQEILEAYDRLVDMARDRNMKIFGTLTYYEADLGDGSSATNRRNIEEYAELLAFLAERYQGKIEYWEIFNEPNHPEYWQPSPDADGYFELLKSAYNAVKQVDSDIKVVACASSEIDLDYITQILALGGANYLDIVSIHPYTNPTPFESSHEADNFHQLRSLVDSYKSDIPIWVTEVGYHTEGNDYGVTEDRQADMIVRSYVSLIAHGAEMIAWYDFVEDSSVTSGKVSKYGLLRKDLTDKPAFTAFKNMVSLLGESDFVDSISIGFENQAMLFRDDSGVETIVAWTYDETYDEGGQMNPNEREITLTLNGTVSNIYDINKNVVLAVSHQDDDLTVTISSSPIYIVGDFTVSGI